MSAFCTKCREPKETFTCENCIAESELEMEAFFKSQLAEARAEAEAQRQRAEKAEHRNIELERALKEADLALESICGLGPQAMCRQIIKAWLSGEKGEHIREYQPDVWEEMCAEAAAKGDES